MKGAADLGAADLIGLLSVYSTQFGSYTTLLWQVPALSLTAQSFLMTVALGSGSSSFARLISAVLSAFIAFASSRLMHDQRGHAINDGELARRLSETLALGSLLGNFIASDGKPRQANAEKVWSAIDKRIYGVWIVCMLLFAVVDALVVISAVWHLSWFASVTAR